MAQRSRALVARMASLASAVVLALAPSRAYPAGFVFVNDNLADDNSVSGFAVEAAGALSEISGSPFPSGGHGSGRGLFASNRIAVSRAGGLLFAGNERSSTIAVFTIDPATGSLDPVAGSPFLAAGLTGAGMTLAVTPDGRFLMAASVSASVIRTFEVGKGGALAEVSGSPFRLASDSGPAGMQVSPDGRLLAVALSGFGDGQGAVGTFVIGGDGVLTSAPGSPTLDGGAGRAASVAWSRGSDRLFVGEATGGTTLVDVFDVASDGSLTPVAGSPFDAGVGLNSNVVLAHPDGRFLFVSNQGSSSIAVLAVDSDGSLATVPGAPFPTVSFGAPGGMAIDHAGEFLYVPNLENTIEAFGVGGDGTLTSLPGSPFAGRQPSALQSIAFFLPCPPITLAPKVIADGRAGEAYRAQLSAEGGLAPHVFAVTAGALPPGVVVSPSGEIAGTPTGGGAFAFTLTARDAEGCPGSAAYTMTVIADSEPPSTAAEQSPAPNANGWNRESVRLRLAATDNPGGSGVARIHFSLAGAEEGGGATDGDVVEVSVRAEGVTTVTYFAIDNAGNVEEPRSRVVRIDRAPPEMECHATPDLLWPPNHELVPVSVSVAVRDDLSGPDGFGLKVASSSEPDSRTDDEDFAGDIQGFVPGTSDTTGALRAERSGVGVGRVYLLGYAGRDRAGNTAACAVTVAVPHSLSASTGAARLVATQK